MSKITPSWQKTTVLESVFDQLSDALVLYDPEFRITGVNRSAEKLFGMASEEMLGKHCQEVFKCSLCEPGCGVLVGLNQNPGAPHCTVRLHTGNGMERLVVMRTTQMFDDDGHLTGVVATIKDITEEAAPQKREVIAESGPMREVLNFVRRVAASEATTILLEGENGTGKDLVAKTLHYQSLRQAEPFIAINCAAIPDSLLESELFGYEKGAFTDARAQKRGIFELADKGTLFLDEIDVHPANIYHALYKVGKRYGLLTRKKPEEYLRMSYRTCLKWFNTGPWKHIGLMEGSNAINILEDIKREGWQAEYKNLLQEMKECEEQFLRDPYPYSSELLIDQTAHEQVYFFTRFFGDTAKNLKTVQVLKALGGNQPVWFRYGNDKREADICCYYNASLNGMALLRAFEDSGDLDAFTKGYAGVMSVMQNVLPDGMGFDQFICTPGVYNHEPPRTFESGTGLWGFMKSAKSYVVKDETFGLIGCGCQVEASGEEVRVYPKDGLKKRIRFVDHKIDLEATQGEISQLVLNEIRHSIEIHMGDSTGFVKDATIEIHGLESGEYRLSYGRTSRRVSSDGTLAISVPISEARHITIAKA